MFIFNDASDENQKKKNEIKVVIFVKVDHLKSDSWNPNSPDVSPSKPYSPHRWLTHSHKHFLTLPLSDKATTSPQPTPSFSFSLLLFIFPLIRVFVVVDITRTAHISRSNHSYPLDLYLIHFFFAKLQYNLTERRGSCLFVCLVFHLIFPSANADSTGQSFYIYAALYI